MYIVRRITHYYEQEYNVPKAEETHLQRYIRLICTADLLDPETYATWLSNYFSWKRFMIVLIVFGLTIGSIKGMVGMEESSRMRKTVNQISSLDIATSLFKEKYKALPGDFSKANKILYAGNRGPEVNGDGNGCVDQEKRRCREPLSFSGELPLFFEHLQVAGFIDPLPGNNDTEDKAPGFSFPAMKLGNGGGFVLFNRHKKHYWQTVAGAFDRVGGRIIPGTLKDFIKPANAYGIDAKLDNGKANKGTIQARWHFNGKKSILNCYDKKTGYYSFDNPDGVCSLRIKAQF